MWSCLLSVSSLGTLGPHARINANVNNALATLMPRTDQASQRRRWGTMEYSGTGCLGLMIFCCVMGPEVLSSVRVCGAASVIYSPKALLANKLVGYNGRPTMLRTTRQR